MEEEATCFIGINAKDMVMPLLSALLSSTTTQRLMEFLVLYPESHKTLLWTKQCVCQQRMGKSSTPWNLSILSCTTSLQVSLPDRTVEYSIKDPVGAPANNTLTS